MSGGVPSSGGSGDLVHLPDLPDLSRLPEPSARLLDLLQPGLSLLVRTIWRTRVHHADRIPAGGAILAVNHVGVLDGPLVIVLVPQAQAMAKRELWRSRPLGRLLTAVGQIPIDRWNPDPGSLRRCVQVIAAGRKLVIFPESHRGIGDFTNFKGGAAYLALVTGAPVVPVALLGAAVGSTGVRGVPRPGSVVHVVYGEPVVVEPKQWPRTAAEVADLSERLRRACAQHVQQAQIETGLVLTPKDTP